jgi:hypothetical protein
MNNTTTASDVAEFGSLDGTVQRDVAIARIKAALKRRSGRSWSVTGGTGTAWGWIRIKSMPKACGRFGEMSAADITELATLLGVSENLVNGGFSVPASSDHRKQAIALATTGTTLGLKAEQYWD